MHRVLVAEAEKDDLEYLKKVDKQGGYNKGDVSLFIVLLSVFKPEIYCRRAHNEHKRGYENDVLRRHVSFRITCVAADSEKFLHDIFLTWILLPILYHFCRILSINI